MQTAARVREVDSDRALLACDPDVAGCGRCGGVGRCNLMRLSGGRAASLEVPARAAGGQALEAGARVTVEVSDGELLRAAGRGYLPPLAGVLCGAALARSLAPGHDVWTLIGAAGGLVLGWLAARAWLRHAPPAVSVRIQGAEP
jgi:positive regulator of sigma E activity